MMARLERLVLVLAVSVILFITHTYVLHPAASTDLADPFPSIRKALIIASQSTSNLTFLASAAAKGNWPLYTYITDGPPTSQQPLTTPSNSSQGNEAMVYLTYIIDNYHNLPDIMFFHHDHEVAWHQKYSSATEFQYLNLITVLRQGYVSPRCLNGCENVIELSSDTLPLKQLLRGSRDIRIASVLSQFLDEKEDLPSKIAAPCCAQFAVSKEAVRTRSLQTWVGLRNWLLETDLDNYSKTLLHSHRLMFFLVWQSRTSSVRRELTSCLFRRGTGAGIHLAHLVWHGE